MTTDAFGACRSADALLGDGVPFSRLFDRNRRHVSQRIYSDPQVYQLELERIWAKAWIVVGHESEIPKTGDYITRRVGDDPVILARTKTGEIACVLNVCPHRGATVCRTGKGNANLLRCIYHGWTFNLDGAFRGAPYKDQMYPDGLPSEEVGLRAARVETFGGIIFVNWSDEAPPLEDYLGDFKWYLNLMFNRTGRGVEVLGVPQRFMINANWKIASEQFAGDAYHAGQLHRSLGELRGWDLNDPKLWAMYDTKVATIAGHSAICFHQDNRFASRVDGFDRLSSIDKLKALPPPGMPPEMVPEMADRFDEAELATLANTPPSNGILFPHAGLWSTSALLPNGEMTSFFSLRTYVPCGIDKFEFTMWVFAERGTSQEFRDNISRTTSLAQGAAGFVEQDDAEVWPGIATNSKGYIARQNTLKYWAQAPNQPRDDWGGGGHVMTEFSRDDTQWAWWNRYYEFMTEQA